MSYKKYLQQQIKELELQIANSQGDVEKLREDLKKLELKEFEEDLREDSQILLKG